MMKVHQFMHEMRTTSGILGRDGGVNVVFQGDQAGTDGSTIHLPSLPLNETLTHEQVRAMRGYVDHEAGHIRHSDMPLIMDFYDRCLNNGKESLKNIHNALEDVWMESKVMDEYPGSLKNLKQCNELVKSREYPFFKEADNFKTLKEINEDSVCLSITSNKEEFKGPNTWNDKIREEIGNKLKEFSDVWVKEALACKNSGEVITLAKSVYKLLEEDPNLEASSPEDFDPTAGEGDEVGEPGDEVGGKGGGTSEIAEALTGEGGEVSSGDGAAGCIGQMLGDFTSSGYKVASTSDDYVYTRGDRSGPYLGLNDIVNSTDSGKYENLKSNLRSNIMVMKNKLKRALLARQQRDWDFGREQGRLDTKRLVSAYSGGTSVYKQRTDREDEDTAISILIDLSGSMRGRKAETARDCAIALAECFEGSGLSYKITGFCNKRASLRHFSGEHHRYEPLDTVVFKGYDDSLRVSRGSVGMLDDAVGGNNSDYDFIVNELNGLKDRRESRKVLFVLSDGSPACEADADTHEHIKHCKEVIKEAQSKDYTECVGIGICSSAVEEIYSNSVVVDDVSELSSKVFHKLTDILVKGKKVGGAR